MAKAQLKVLLFLIVLGITLGSMAMAYYIYAKVLKPDARIREEIAVIKKSDRPLADPGRKRFDIAAALLEEGKIDAARDALYKLLQQFPESPTCAEAKRIIGEINLDSIFSPSQKAGKKDYIVQPGDSLSRVASRQNTSMDLIIRLNGLMGTVLQPGDHLTLVALEFSLVVDVSAKTVTLRRKVGDKEYFFKEYQAVDVVLPPGLRAPNELEIGGKSAIADGKSVTATDPRYVDAEKWLHDSRSRIALRTPPVAKAPAPPEPEAAAPKTTILESFVEAPQKEAGVFLAREDLEELFALVRTGSKLYLIR